MRIVLVLLLVISLASCATKKERALKSFNKALSLDPDILSNINLPIRIDTQIVRHVEIVTKEKIVNQSVNVDSLKKVLEGEIGAQKVLLENSELKLELFKTKQGWLDFKATIKKDTISVVDTVQVVIEKQLPAKALTKTVHVRGYFYYSGIILNLISLIVLTLIIWRMFKR